MRSFHIWCMKFPWALLTFPIKKLEAFHFCDMWYSGRTCCSLEILFLGHLSMIVGCFGWENSTKFVGWRSSWGSYLWLMNRFWKHRWTKLQHFMKMGLLWHAFWQWWIIHHISLSSGLFFRLTNAATCWVFLLIYIVSCGNGRQIDNHNFGLPYKSISRGNGRPFISNHN